MKQLPAVAQVPTVTVFQIYALERAINGLRNMGHSLETSDDRWAGLMLHEDAEQLEALLAILKPAAAPGHFPRRTWSRCRPSARWASPTPFPTMAGNTR